MTKEIYLETKDSIHLMAQFQNLQEWRISSTNIKNNKLKIAFHLKIEKIRDNQLKFMNLPIIRSLI
jgi:hypothetical protein